MTRIFIIVLMVCFRCNIYSASALDLPPVKSSAQIVEDNDMNLAQNGKAHVFLAFDTTDPELLKLGLELGEVLFQLSGARFRVVDSKHAGDKWGSIVLQRSIRSATFVPKEYS